MRTAFTTLTAAVVIASTSPAQAAVNFYGNQAAFNLASATTLQASFEGFSHVVDTPGIANPYTEGAVRFSEPSNLYVATPGGAAVTRTDIEFPIASNVLTVSGNEDITMTFAGPAPTAVGFESFTNRFDAPTVTVFDTAGLLIGTYALAQGPNTAGFVGITSSVGIGAVRWLADRGQIKDTAIDNVYVGQVPEPATAVLLVLGGAVCSLASRRRRDDAARQRPATEKR